MPSEECPGLPVATKHGTDASLVVVSSLVNGGEREEKVNNGRQHESPKKEGRKELD